jgi:hypothetical protein
MLRKLTAAVFMAALIAAPAFAADTPVSSPATHQAATQNKPSHAIRSVHQARHAKHLYRTKHLAGHNKLTPPKHAQVQNKPAAPSVAN